jgi:hypothetical protein
MAVPLQSDASSFGISTRHTAQTWPCWSPPATTHQSPPSPPWSRRPPGIWTAWRLCLSSLAANAVGREKHAVAACFVSSSSGRPLTMPLPGRRRAWLRDGLLEQSARRCSCSNGSLRTSSHEPSECAPTHGPRAPGPYVNMLCALAPHLPSAPRSHAAPSSRPRHLLSARIYPHRITASRRTCPHCTVAFPSRESPLRDTSKSVIGTSFFFALHPFYATVHKRRPIPNAALSCFSHRLLSPRFKAAKSILEQGNFFLIG